MYYLKKKIKLILKKILNTFFYKYTASVSIRKICLIFVKPFFNFFPSQKRVIVGLYIDYLNNKVNDPKVSRKEITPCAIKPKLKLAYLSPMIPDKTGVAAYSNELVNNLNCYYDITLVLDEQLSVQKFIDNFKVVSFDEFSESYEKYDRLIYHIGNSKFHSKIYEYFFKHPGVIVLHDIYIDDLLRFSYKDRFKYLILKKY